MARTVIVSEETIRVLVEQNAAMSAWYHEFVRASREQAAVVTPRQETIARFGQRIGVELPEVASIVRGMGSFPPYSPPPLDFSPAAAREPPGAEPAASEAQPQADKPPLVNPRHVKY